PYRSVDQSVFRFDRRNLTSDGVASPVHKFLNPKPLFSSAEDGEHGEFVIPLYTIYESHVDYRHARNVVADFSSSNPLEVLVISADSLVRILDGAKLVQKYKDSTRCGTSASNHRKRTPSNGHTGKRNALGKEAKEESLKIVVGMSLRVLIFDEDHYDVVLVILLQ
ncbi:hypothetical protein Tco_0700268, partial [Tanacetum coccineum]